MTRNKYHITLERGVWHLQIGRVRCSLYRSKHFRHVCEAAKLTPLGPSFRVGLIPKDHEA